MPQSLTATQRISTCAREFDGARQSFAASHRELRRPAENESGAQRFRMSRRVLSYPAGNGDVASPIALKQVWSSQCPPPAAPKLKDGTLSRGRARQACASFDPDPFSLAWSHDTRFQTEVFSQNVLTSFRISRVLVPMYSDARLICSSSARRYSMTEKATTSWTCSPHLRDIAGPVVGVRPGGPHCRGAVAGGDRSGAAQVVRVVAAVEVIMFLTTAHPHSLNPATGGEQLRDRVSRCKPEARAPLPQRR
jgi:hypothetical protein